MAPATSTLLQTPLFSWHTEHAGRMVNFAGWSMPVQYHSIVAEHVATRAAVGLFDVSHMGRFRIAGPDAAPFLDRIVSRRVLGMRPGQIRYALVTDDQGGVLDDVLIYHLGGAAEPSTYRLVVNASNRQKIWHWLEMHRHDADVELLDMTLETAMIAVQGPQAIDILRASLPFDPSTVRYYHCQQCEILGHAALVSRTGYTGEDGCELIVAATIAPSLWTTLMAAAARVQGTAAGLGARDTLRLEAGMPLYGHELTEATDPFQANLAFAVDLADRSFPGRNALVKRADDATRPRRVGLQVLGKRVPREGYAVLAGTHRVGQVTSGTFSPTLAQPIAMAYVQPDQAILGTQLAIDVRGYREAARVVELPFYRRPA
jgi:aminomethyltransferase